MISPLDYARRPRRYGLQATVPGDVHLDLMRAGRIADPLVGDGAAHCRWIGEREWWYARTFPFDADGDGRHEIVFDGLCYVADVWLNGVHLGRHLNMHRPFRADVTNAVRKRNRIEVRLLAFLPGIESRLDLNWGKRRSAAIDPAICTRRGWMRKAAYSLGWDWTEGLPLCGIWRAVRIETIPAATIEDPFIRAGAGGEVRISAVCRSVLKERTPARFEVRLFDDKGGRDVAGAATEIQLEPGCTPCGLRMHVSDPKLWWPAGMGPQDLYTAHLHLRIGRKTVAQESVRFGFRDVMIDESRSGKDRARFRFVVNGEPVYAKGGNWVPPSIIPAGVTKQHYRRLIDLAVEAGMNYLRFWGGGIYEGEEFYRLCDERGVMLWHDMMFGNNEHPDFDASFLAEAEREFCWAIKSLRNHPSIVIWCGSNETDQVSGRMRAKRPGGKYYGERLLHEHFPRWLSALDTTRQYRPSSGCMGKYSPPGDDLLNPRYGVSHTVYTDPFGTDESLDDWTASFVNEWYGASPPAEETMRRFLKKRERTWSGPVASMHNFLTVLESRGTPSVLEKYFSHHDLTDLNAIPFDEVCELFRTWHVEHMIRSIEHYRRQKWTCSGNSFWMYNSAFPSMDWSIVDHYGVPKAAFFAVKRANRPLLPVIALYQDRVVAYVVNDTRERLRGKLSLSMLSFAGREAEKTVCDAVVEPNSSQAFLALESVRNHDPATHYLKAVLITSGGRRRIVNHRFPGKYKEHKLPAARVRARRVPGKNDSFSLTTDTVARRVCLGPSNRRNRPDDNFFDLLPGEKKIVTFERPLLLSDVRVTWQNSADRAVVLSRLKPDQWDITPATPLHVDLELFNPTTRTRRPRIDADLPTGLTLTGPGRVSLPPGQTVTVRIAFHADPFAAPVGIHPVVLRVGSIEVRKRIVTRPAFTFAPDGKLEIDNRSEMRIPEGTLSVRWQTTDGARGRQRIGPFPIPAGHMTRPVSLPADIAPFSGELLGAGHVLQDCWLGSRDGQSLWNSLPRKRFTSKGLCSTRTRRRDWPSVFTEGHGFLVARSDADPAVTYGGDHKAQAIVFMHHNAKSFFLSLFLWNVDYAQPYADDEPVSQGSCVEFGMTTTREDIDFEASLALTRKGPQVRVRRRHGEATGKVDAGARFKVFVLPESRMITYHYAVDWRSVLPKIGSSVRISLVLRNPDNQSIEIFQGINVPKDPKLFGRLKIGR